jgi:hypothetical protein
LNKLGKRDLGESAFFPKKTKEIKKNTFIVQSEERPFFQKRFKDLRKLHQHIFVSSELKDKTANYGKARTLYNQITSRLHLRPYMKCNNMFKVHLKIFQSNIILTSANNIIYNYIKQQNSKRIWDTNMAWIFKPALTLDIDQLGLNLGAIFRFWSWGKVKTQVFKRIESNHTFLFIINTPLCFFILTI